MAESLNSNPYVVSVLDFLTEINAVLTGHRARIEGEVTSVNKTYPKAIYFNIKDLKHDALLNCIIWRSTYDQNGVDINVGDKIIVTGTPEIYASRGSFSLKTQTIEYAGEGALKKSYDELKAKLIAEGLLDQSRKRLLPDYPKKIGVITSRSGVVIQDFNSNLGRYGFQTTMVDSRVEGKDAIHEILAALKTMAKQDIEVLVIMRGGGSWESLQAFNTESVIRAISAFKCPVLTGIGHDVDLTLAELVADVGASTPTAVAEALNETWDTLVSSLDAAESKIRLVYQRRLAEVLRIVDIQSGILFRKYDQVITKSQQSLTMASTTVQTYFRSLEKTITQASTAFQRVVGLMRSKIKGIQTEIVDIQTEIPKEFRTFIAAIHKEISTSSKYLLIKQERAMKTILQTLISVDQSIKLSDPSRNLKLGYSLSYVDGKLVRSMKDISVGDAAETRLADGSFTSEINKII